MLSALVSPQAVQVYFIEPGARQVPGSVTTPLSHVCGSTLLRRESHLVQYAQWPRSSCLNCARMCSVLGTVPPHTEQVVLRQVGLVLPLWSQVCT